MYVNGKSLLLAAPIADMLTQKCQHEESGTSYGLTEMGYDITLKQDIIFYPPDCSEVYTERGLHGFVTVNGVFEDYGRFCLASANEYFQMPTNLGGEVKDKSTMARKGLQVFNTVIEPGWRGYLTLELAYWGNVPLRLYAGQGIAQVLFTELTEHAKYDGKYQEQENRPVAAR